MYPVITIGGLGALVPREARGCVHVPMRGLLDESVLGLRVRDVAIGAGAGALLGLLVGALVFRR